jgi:hypothetical protein
MSSINRRPQTNSVSDRHLIAHRVFFDINSPGHFRGPLRDHHSHNGAFFSTIGGQMAAISRLTAM